MLCSQMCVSRWCPSCWTVYVWTPQEPVLTGGLWLSTHAQSAVTMATSTAPNSYGSRTSAQISTRWIEILPNRMAVHILSQENVIFSSYWMFWLLIQSLPFLLFSFRNRHRNSGYNQIFMVSSQFQAFKIKKKIPIIVFWSKCSGKRKHDLLFYLILVNIII